MTTPETESRAGDLMPPPEPIAAAVQDLVTEFKGLATDLADRLHTQETRMTRLSSRMTHMTSRPPLSADLETRAAPHQLAFGAYLRSGDDDGLRNLGHPGRAGPPPRPRARPPPHDPRRLRRAGRPPPRPGSCPMSGFDLDDEMGTLASGLEEAMRGAISFSSELGRVTDSLGEASQGLGNLERGFAGGIRRAIDGLIIDGDRLSDALRTVGRSMADTVYRAAMKPLTDRLGGLLAQGVGGLMGGVMPFAKGGVVSRATHFPMQGGTGLMGEAGPEAILPLSRGADGRLGVRAQGGGAPQVTINVHTPDAQGFRRSQGQIAAEMGRLLARGSRNR